MKKSLKEIKKKHIEDHSGAGALFKEFILGGQSFSENYGGFSRFRAAENINSATFITPGTENFEAGSTRSTIHLLNVQGLAKYKK